MRKIAVVGYKGGTGKSTIARGLATTLAHYRTQDGRPVVPIVILADLLAQSPQAERIVHSLFNGDGSGGRYMPGRRYYLTLRSGAGNFVKAALASEKVQQDQIVLIADSGAQLVLDAARAYASADAFIIPYMRGDLVDAVPKLVDTLTHLQHTKGLKDTPDSSILGRSHIVLNGLPAGVEAREALLKQADYRAMHSNPVIAERLMRACLVDMKSIADTADLMVTPTPHGLKHMLRAFRPFTQELVERAGFVDLVENVPQSGADTYKLLQQDDGDIILGESRQPEEHLAEE